MKRWRQLGGLLALALCTLRPHAAEARADFVLIAEGAGFADPTARAPVGGNDGTTLGDQRRRALARALEVWGAALDSAVPIVVRATFPDLSCTDAGAVLGQAYAVNSIRGLPSEPDGPYYPSALADRLVGRDLAPGEPDLAIELNAAVDAAPCSHIAGRWYYGFDGHAAADENDLIQVALHELAHGLGFSSTVDPVTGMPQYTDRVDVYTTHVLDLDLGLHWDALSPQQRVQSIANVRRLVFDGAETQRMAATFLAAGEPTLTLTPMPANAMLARSVGDVEFADNPAREPVSGPLQRMDPSDGCDAPQNDMTGTVALIEPSGRCSMRQSVLRAAMAGAVGAVVMIDAPASAPAEPLDGSRTLAVAPISAVTITQEAGQEILAALQLFPITASLAGDPTRLLGADAEGRPLLFASRPALPGSSLSHFDSLARPNLLMEAYVQSGANHQLDLAEAVLHDLGWYRNCGNGVVDVNEQCDLGSGNSDAPGAGCRSNCRKPGCGDGARDEGEGCDEGGENDDLKPGACRTTCQLAHCGDGVMDPGEACDQGLANSDVQADACRSGCTLARCGDGVVDGSEECDGPGCPADCRVRAQPVSDASTPTLPQDAGVRPWTDPPVEQEPSEGGGCAMARSFDGGGACLLFAALWVRRLRDRPSRRTRRRV